MEKKVRLVWNRRKNEKVEIAIYFPGEKKTTYVPTDVKVPSRYWDTDLNRISPKMPRYAVINKKLKAMVFDTEEILSVSETIEEFRSNLKSKDISFVEFATEELDKMNISPGTKKSYSHTLVLLKEFNPTRINYNFAVDFDRFLNKKLTNKNTIKKHHRITGQFIRAAYHRGLIDIKDYNSYKLFKPKGQDVNKDYLTPEEIERIKNVELDESWDVVRDMFLFSYYTALRLSDVLELNHSHLHVINGNLRLIKPIRKLSHVNRKIDINLTENFQGAAEELIHKYPEDSIFPKMSVPSINYALKKIAEKAGINKDISFHTARHSSLTFVAAISGDMYAVMQHGGITNPSTAQRYIHLSERFMKNIDWRRKVS